MFTVMKTMAVVVMVAMTMITMTKDIKMAAVSSNNNDGGSGGDKLTGDISQEREEN